MFPQIKVHPSESQTKIHHTLHVQQRMAQRNISDEDLDFVLQYGKEYRRAGAVHIHLRRCDIPNVLQNKYGRLEGTTVVLCRQEANILTVHRNRQQGPRRIKKKAAFGYKSSH